MSVAQWVVGGGATAVFVALLGGFFGFRMNQANYAKVINEAAANSNPQATWTGVITWSFHGLLFLAAARRARW